MFNVNIPYTILAGYARYTYSILAKKVYLTQMYKFIILYLFIMLIHIKI